MNSECQILSIRYQIMGEYDAVNYFKRKNIMFIGHYAVSLALKSVQPKLSLGWLFIAVQFVDFLFFSFALFDLERFSLMENYTESTHFKLDYMPFSHSLVACFLWALAIYLLVKLFMSSQKKQVMNTALVIFVAVVSHWCLDLLVHTPDLPLFLDNSYLLGFGLWNIAWLTYLLEAIFILAGLYWYMTSTNKTGVKDTTIAKYGMPTFVVFLLVINVINIFGPLSEEDTVVSTAISALLAYSVFALIAFWLDKKRTT
jgi:hypothetical protein